MGLFSRKRHIQLEIFCEDFFTNQILTPSVAGLDFGKTLSESIKQSIVNVSPSFSSVEPDQLKEEITLLRFEMFSLALLHTFGSRTAHCESRYTKGYLHSRGREDIWDTLIDYNKIIAKATAYEFDANTPAGKIARLSVDKMRMDEFTKWAAAGFDGECVARVVNRLASESSWNKKITPDLLAWKLADRLECKQTDAGYLVSSATISGFYQGAKGVMSEIKIDA